MKKQFVATIQEGDTVNDYFLAARKDLREQANGSKFLGMVFKDRTGEIGGILWNNAASIARQFEIGDVVNVRGNVTSYQDRLQIRVEQVVPLAENEFEKSDLIETSADTEAHLAAFRELMGSIAGEWLSRLTKAFLDDEAFMERFTQASAGKKWHHAQPGGLLRHCLEMARIACTMCELYPNIDRDLLLAGCFLHDIGKLDEMSQDMLVEYSTAGKLLGHLEIGCEMVRKKMDAIPGFPEPLRMHLIHLILSHHGELVNGSPVVPKTLEAMVLCQCDNLDAQADAFTRVIRETRERHLEWSDYIPLIDRQIWAK
ncbi:MAG TPA: HD domain-containing protein [Candidatus Hydrogenedentes bacterium]|nr:HD domain-containing protein [Candidatus Hydrogenedentota bacterium]HPC18527.1 HD domain-containing protein [Candidatus Hydrogenedentota bacterium]HRT22250.1 HD domain-containing protein [Candidatus Hydrogenedentota bacterium]HRT67006.1 HD domain-containing protein [Candidatus Hydrogenedentota bacterium]